MHLGFDHVRIFLQLFGRCVRILRRLVVPERGGTYTCARYAYTCARYANCANHANCANFTCSRADTCPELHGIRLLPGSLRVPRRWL